MRAYRGFTLIETLISASLGLVVLGLLTDCWLMASKSWTQAEQDQSTQRSTLAVSYRMTHDFNCSMVGSLNVVGNATSPTTVVSFISDDNPAWDPNSGAMLFHHWVQYRYTAAAQTVERQEVPTSPISPVGLDGLANTTVPVWSAGTAGTLLGQSVNVFQVSSANAAPLLSVRLQASSGSASSDLGVVNILSHFYATD